MKLLLGREMNRLAGMGGLERDARADTAQIEACRPPESLEDVSTLVGERVMRRHELRSIASRRAEFLAENLSQYFGRDRLVVLCQSAARRISFISV